MYKIVLRVDGKYHTEYKFSSRVSGWDPIDDNDAPQRISTIDGLFKNVIAHLRNVEITFKDMDKAVAKLPPSLKSSSKFKSLSGKLKHDVQSLKNEAVTAWKACIKDIKDAKKARKDSAYGLQKPRNDISPGFLSMLEEVGSEGLGDTVAALNAVRKEARWLVSSSSDIKKLLISNLAKRLKKAGVASSTAEAHINKLVKASNEIYKIGHQIFDLTTTEIAATKKH